MILLDQKNEPFKIKRNCPSRVAPSPTFGLQTLLMMY